MVFHEVLFPGRHHAITRFQVDLLQRLLTGSVAPMADDAVVIWPVTSANHASTRRNPLPGHRRESLIERVSAAADLPSLVVPVPDVPRHPRFADLVLTTVATELAHRPAPTPQRTLVACSTPEVADSYRALGYTVVGVEDTVSPEAVRPWQVVEQIAADDPGWVELAHPQTVEHYARYGFVEQIRELFADPVVSAEGDLTATRDYRSYAEAFETASARKYEQIGPWLEPGRIVDIGCATGGLLEQIAADPRFAESDLFGVDVARPLLDEAEHKKEAGVFANPNIWFIRANILNGPVLPAGSVDATVTVALTHEILSYGSGRPDVEAFARNVALQTRRGGIWINSDVLGPDRPDEPVVLRVRTDDGESLAAPWTDLDEISRPEVAERLGTLSTAGRLVQFGHDFPRLSGATFAPVPRPDLDTAEASAWQLTRREAMEFVAAKDYLQNWLSECHEQFCALDWQAWTTILTDAGFTLEPASTAWRNDWLVEHRFSPSCELLDPDDARPVEWPVTHLLTVARRRRD